ncbi:Disease resistance response protein 206 [Apostasia shenzhenica]|uniref:Dirigent protein n=1 Tax=Apostasia shenzhenica TaxID=1088818 RepID=A0A2H9ZSB3_9ASPA|nr:Disease resistance response protein 206 [Apostasia shenzhenica]
MASIPSVSLFLKTTLAAAALAVAFLSPATLAAENETRFHFFTHERQIPPNRTVIPSVSIPTTPHPFVFGFGSILVFDNLLAAGSDPASRHLGRSQGLVAYSSLNGEDIFIVNTLVFKEPRPFAGSSITLLARNPLAEKVRELPVVAGTGKFRLARGYALQSTYYSNATTGVYIYEFELILLQFERVEEITTQSNNFSAAAVKL